jgi:hypothetical protein
MQFSLSHVKIKENVMARLIHNSSLTIVFPRKSIICTKSDNNKLHSFLPWIEPCLFKFNHCWSSTQTMTKVFRNTWFFCIGFTNFLIYLIEVLTFLLLILYLRNKFWRFKRRHRPIIFHHCTRIALDKQKCETFDG